MDKYSFNKNFRLNDKRYSREQCGFTIIELVVVIVLMGILTVTVAPKMFNSDGFQEVTYQAEVVTVLRNIQLKAMQQTESNTNGCHSVVITSKALSVSSSCGLNSTNTYIPDVKIESKHNVTFQTTGNAATVFTFDQLGRPKSGCSPCNIILLGESTSIIRIESEGYIHAL